MGKKQKLNLIEELTTHKCDYQFWPIKSGPQSSDYRRREEPKVKSPPPALHVDPQSHVLYDPSVYIPFDLYLQPKPIVGTDPRDCFKLRIPHKSSAHRQKVALTTCLSPALCLQDIEDEDKLQTILRYTYTGLHKILMEEAALNISKAPRPFNRVDSGGASLKFKPELYPPLPPGWVGAAKHWDCLQSRSWGDPFKSFWTRRGPEVLCGCCDNPIPDMLSKETKEQISQLTREGKLRLPYDVTKTGYRGYRPVCARGVPLQKKS